MGTHSANRSTHQTIAAANTAEVVTLTGDWLEVEITNWDASNKVYFTVDGTVPTVGGDNTFVVGPGQAVQVDANSPDAPRANVTVTLICAAAGTAYSVTGYNQ